MDSVLSPLALTGGIGMVLVAVSFTAYVGLRHLGWKYFGFGMLAWVITVACKFAIAIPMNPPIFATLSNGLPAPFGIGIFDIYVGLLTGLTEVLFVWILMRYSRLGRATWNQALAFGIGFGAVEAFLLGLSSAATILSLMLTGHSLPAQAMAQLALANNPLMGVAPIVERIATIFVHIACNVLIFYGLARAEWRWFWLAFVGKSLFDAWAAFGQLSGMTASLQQIWALEVVVILFGIAGWYGTRWIGLRYPAQAELAPDTPAQAEAAADGERKRWSPNADFASWGILGLLVFLSLGLGLVGAAQNNVVMGQERENLLTTTEPKTTNLLTALNRGDYAAFSMDLDERTKSAIPEDKFVSIRNQVNGKIGNYVSRRVDRIRQVGSNFTVEYIAQFDNDDPVTVRISFTVAEPHAITGLWFDSQKLR